MTYQAPVEDIIFNIAHVARGRGAATIPDETIEEWTAILDQAAAFTEEIVAPTNRAADLVGSVLENGVVRTPAGWHEAYAAWVKAGWNGTALPAAYGGAGLPTTIGTATMEMLTSACMAFSTLPVLTQGAVEALAAHADEELRRRYLPKLVAGTWTATMNLTEPQAGSDLGLLRTRAVAADDGTYRIYGQKCFITFGEHDLAENIIHLVLARLPDAPSGTKGISLFLVPKLLPTPDGRPGESNDLRCAGLEHKLGIKASPTCTMAYGDNGGAVGWLVGEPHRGLACMFTMMNKARLATGLQGVAIAERAYQQALAYARQRRQGNASGYAGPAPIIAHPDVRRMLGRMRALTAASRAITYFIAGAIDDAHGASDEALQHRGQAYADLLTPAFKAFATDSGVEVASLGIQVHGGMGYVEETGAAQHWRDARIAPIYEGTNGIQAIDLVTRKILRDHGRSMHMLIDECRTELADVASLPQNARTALSAATENIAVSLDALADATEWLLASDRDPEQVLYAAAPYLRLTSIALGASLLLKGAAAAAARPDAGSRPFAQMKEAQISVATLFADELSVEAPSLLRKIKAPTAALQRWAAALEIET